MNLDLLYFQRAPLAIDYHSYSFNVDRYDDPLARAELIWCVPSISNTPKLCLSFLLSGFVSANECLTCNLLNSSSDRLDDFFTMLAHYSVNTTCERRHLLQWWMVFFVLRGGFLIMMNLGGRLRHREMIIWVPLQSLACRMTCSHIQDDFDLILASFFDAIFPQYFSISLDGFNVREPSMSFHFPSGVFSSRATFW